MLAPNSAIERNRYLSNFALTIAVTTNSAPSRPLQSAMLTRIPVLPCERAAVLRYLGRQSCSVPLKLRCSHCSASSLYEHLRLSLVNPSRRYIRPRRRDAPEPARLTPIATTSSGKFKSDAIMRNANHVDAQGNKRSVTCIKHKLSPVCTLPPVILTICRLAEDKRSARSGRRKAKEGRVLQLPKEIAWGQRSGSRHKRAQSDHLSAIDPG